MIVFVLGVFVGLLFGPYVSGLYAEIITHIQDGLKGE